MKLNNKILLVTTISVTSLVSVMEFLMISTSLHNQIHREIQQSELQYNLLHYHVNADIAYEQSNMDRKLAQYRNENWKFSIYDEAGELRWTSMESPVEENWLIPLENNVRRYRIVKAADRYYVQMVGMVYQDAWFLVLETEITAIFAQHLETMKVFYMMYLVISFLVIILMLIFSEYITSPINELIRSTRNIASGDYEAPIKMVRGKEFQELASSFAQMQKAISEKVQELELEARRKDDFMANFSHELKTPLTSIVGYAETLLLQDLPQQEHDLALAYIAQEGERLERLSYKMMDLMLVDQPFMFQKISIRVFFEQIEEIVKARLGAHALSFTLVMEEATVAMEQDLFTTMILNLIDNSAKADATEIRVSGIFLSDDLYEICLSDNGQGIPEESIPNVKDAFYMVDRSRSRSRHGVGLGLALCERIAKLHQTTLRIESELERGTRIYFSLRGEHHV